MPETPNHSYNVPDEGEQDWHVPLNENFEQYDTDIEIRDESGNRSDYEPVQGAKFLATDTGVVHLGDGENWIASLAFAEYRAPSRSNTPGIAFGYQNNLNGDASTISGGGENSAVQGGTVGGGTFNTVTGSTAVIGGGSQNTASGFLDTIGGGYGNETDGGSAQEGGQQSVPETGGATVVGGQENTASDQYATVAGGKNNTASGSYSFAAGREAEASENGSFVWADGTRRTISATQPNEVLFQAGGGFTIFSASDASAGVQLDEGSGSWSSLSAASAKSNVESVDPQGVLAGVEELDVSTWEYDAEADATHMGPMAGEFHDAFGLGADEERITNVDADGVALAAIQGLAERLDEKADRIDRLEREVDERDERIDEQADRIEELEAETETLRERLAALEARVDEGERVADDGSAARSD